MRSPRNERVSSDSPEASPERKCILSGAHGSRDALIRLAISPDGEVLPDVLARAPGRGAWIGVSRADLEIALARGKLKGALARSLGKAMGGAPLTIPEDLPGRIEAALLRAFTDRLGLELKAGRLLLGSDRIAENARMGRVAWLAHAADAAEDGSRKLDQAWRVGREAEGSGLCGITLPLDRAALSVALGRDNVVHLALSDSAAAERLSAPLQRLLHFTAGDLPAGESEPEESGAGESAAGKPAGTADATGTDPGGRTGHAPPFAATTN
jgi:predicted RNA-binding protein YlxR (DUF448 family)